MDFKALDAETDYRRLIVALFGSEVKGEGHEVYITPPSRPDEKVAAMKFSVNLRNGMWHDHKTGESGNMLSLAKEYGPTNWRETWMDTCPGTRELFGTGTQPTTAQEKTTPSEEFALPASLMSLVTTGATVAPTGKAAAVASQPRRVKPTVKMGKRTFAEQALRGIKMTTAAEYAPFCEAWGVEQKVLEKAGAWAFTHNKGALSGVPQLHLPIFDPASSETVGIKKRGLEPIYKAGDGLLKSRNEKGSKVGLFPWHSRLGRKPLLLVEGEKDWAVAEQEFGDKYDVVANLGGASCFKVPWVDAITERWKEIYVCYDADAAGDKGARKVATLLRGGERSIRVVRVPRTGADVFDMVRGDSPDLAGMASAIASAEELGEQSPGEVDASIKYLCDDKDLKQDDKQMSEVLYDLMVDNGALFYHDEGRAYCSWRKRVYWVSGKDHHWNRLIATFTGFYAANPFGTRVHKNMETLARVKGKQVESGRWTRYDGDAIYLPLHDEEQRLIRITGNGMTVVPNGYEDIVFVPNRHVPPIEYLPDEVYNHEKAEALYDLLWQKLNCSPKWQEMMGALVKAFFMYDFMQTHPVIRFQGPAGSGKSTGQQLMSLLLYGHHELIGDITAAALYRVAADMPVVLQDDLEDRDIKRNEWMSKFMLRSAMGGLRIKSDNDSADEVVNQSVNCWVCTSGIHSIADDNAALNERLIVIPVRDASESDNRFAPMPFFKRVAKDRNLLWNYLFREISRMLDAIDNGAMDRVQQSLPRMQRPRLHETYALMSLARGSYDHADHMTLEWLQSADKGEKKAVVESSHVSELLFYLPSFLGDGTEGTGFISARNFDYEVSQDNDLWSCRMDAKMLHAVLSRMSRESGMRYSLSNGRRLSAELRDLTKAGMEDGLCIEYNAAPQRFAGRLTRLYTLEIDVTNIRSLPKAEEAPHLIDPDEEVPF